MSRQKRTAMLVVGNSQALSDAADAITAVLSIKDQQPETLQEAMRTLAVIGKPSQQVNISNCTFTDRPTRQR